MKSVRKIDWDAAQNRRETGRLGHVLYNSESCYIMASKLPAGVEGAPTHVHICDQLYYIIEGELEIELGAETVVARAGEGVFIPAGLPHCNRNVSGTDEVHVEVIAPSVRAGKPLATFVGDDPLPAYDGPPGLVSSRGSTVPNKVIDMSWLIRHSTGSHHAGMYVADMPPNHPGLRTHVHDFDQFYLVLSGQLEVEVALERHSVGPNSLVVIPAGVPHRQWNGSEEPERHVAILAPEPDFPSSPERRWDTVVDFGVSDTQLH
ncbi:MAG: cupin domain-containing protein [Ilumatobacter sp.]